MTLPTMMMHSHSCSVVGIPTIERALSRFSSMQRVSDNHHRQSLLGPRRHLLSSSYSPTIRMRISTVCGCHHGALQQSSSSSIRLLTRPNASAPRRLYQQQQQHSRFSTSPHSASTISTPASSSSYNTFFLSTLQQSLLRPRSLPLPRYLTPRHYTYTLSETFGHASFVLMAISYATSDFLHLRLLAVLGSTSMVVFTYFHPHGRVLWLPLQWNLLFIGINLYRIGKVYYYRYCASNMVSDDMKQFREEHLCTIDPVDYYKLLQLATVEVYDEGTMVMQQGQANPYVRIVLEGELQVLRDGTLTYVLEEGMFVSEGGLHAGLMLRGSIESCCSIVVGPKFDPLTTTITSTATVAATMMTTTSAKDIDGKGGEVVGVSIAEDDTNEQRSQRSNSNSKRQQGDDSMINTNIIISDSNANNAPTTKKEMHRVRCLRWNRTELVDLLLESSNNNTSSSSSSSSGVYGSGGLLGNALRAVLSWDIVRKLKSQRHMLTDGRVKDPTSWSRKREEQGIARYASILQNILRHHSSDEKEDEFRVMRDVLTKYRGIHRIDDESHEKALAKCGWTVEEFRLGKRSRMHKNKNLLHEHDDEDEDDDDDFHHTDRERNGRFGIDNSTRWGTSLKRYSSKLVRSIFQ